MTLMRLVRLLLGIVIAAVILAIILPFVGIPSSHFLPPAMVYSKAQGKTMGYVTGKYYAETGNPFHVGMDEYFLNYSFKAPSPAPRGGVPGPKQVYSGTIRLDQDVDDGIKSPDSQSSQQTPGNQVIPLPAYPVHVTYEQTYPDINGVSDPQALTYQNGRNIGAGSNILSGWLIWVVVSVVLGYIVAMGLETFMKREDI